jgi:peptidoglycan/xylan/chitin deacetylase (PgdA/CDA1 family)
MEAESSIKTSLEQQVQEVDLEHQSTLLMAAAQENVEQQPTQEIDLEQQSTLLMAAAQKDIEQQPTQEIAVEQHHPDQQATLPMAFKPGRRFSRAPHMLLLLWLGAILITGLLLGEVLTGHAAVGGWLAHVFTHNAAPTVVVPVQQVPIAPTPAQSSSIDSVTVGFMDAMMHKDWEQMWLMLAPAAQQLWQGENDFIHFEQAKFGSLTLVSFKEAAAQMQLSWLDPETTQVYPDVATQQVSLAATAPRGLLTGPSNAALDSGLFNNTLFALLPDHRNWLVLVAGPADQDAPVFVPASPPATRLLVPIFMYHHVSNQPTTNALDYNLTVTTTDFNAQLTWLQQQGYQTITLTELFDALYYGKALPAHPMILTFDDGYEDMYTDALPTLLAHHYRGVFFIITGMIGGRYLTWDQIRVLESYGMQIGSHTTHHINVGQPPAWTTTQKELVVSQATLQFQLGQPIQFFCYPTGEPFHHDSVYEQQIVLADLLADGYIGALLDPFTFDSAIQDAQTPYQLPRIRVSGGESLQAYMGILNVTLQYGARTLAYN